jgi:hypothetical protein
VSPLVRAHVRKCDRWRDLIGEVRRAVIILCKDPNHDTPLCRIVYSETGWIGLCRPEDGPTVPVRKG